MKASMTPGDSDSGCMHPEERRITLQKVMADTSLAQLL
jgi:hypothetical protein